MTNRNNADPMMFRFFTEIGIIDQLARSMLENALPGDMKISHFILLHHLQRLGGQWSPARLANALQVTRAAITNTMTRLEAQGLVKIEADPADGRGKLVSLTPAGQRLRDQSIGAMAPLMSGLQQEMGSAPFEGALPFLERLRKHLDEHR